MLTTSLGKKRLVGAMLFLVILSLFFSFNRFPKLDAVGTDLDAVNAPQVQCFQGFCIERDSGSSLLSRWMVFSVTYLRLVSIGMTFAFLVAGLTEAFIFPSGSGKNFESGSAFKRTMRGALIGPVMNLCSACIVPISSAFHRKGAGIDGAIAMVQGSATMNIPALAMVFFVFTPLLGISRLVMAITGALILGPIVMMTIRKSSADQSVDLPTLEIEDAQGSWSTELVGAFRDWARITVGYLVRMGPIMIVAGFASGLAMQWISADTVAKYLGNDLQGIAIATTLGILINVPLLFEIPLVALGLMLGMGTAPAAALLFTAAAGGPVTFWGLGQVMPKRAIATFATATWILGAVGGLAILGIGMLVWDTSTGTQLQARSSIDGNSRPSSSTGTESTAFDVGGGAGVFTLPAGGPTGVSQFRNIAPEALGDKAYLMSRYPGVAIFDYDRDGDQDLYVTQAESNALIELLAEGGPNRLFRNNGDGTFTDVAEEAGVTLTESNSTAVAACDLDNDGYQDLYVGAMGRLGDNLDFRSINVSSGLKAITQDRLFKNNRDGTFTEITETAFGPHVNIRSAKAVACADVDGDGWLDIYVGNHGDMEFVRFDSPAHHGHYNDLFINNGDLTFTEVSASAGVAGGPIVMRNTGGEPITFQDPTSDNVYEGYNPNLRDSAGNRVGEPSGQTWAVLFYDYDDDGDQDLWVADDGDRLKVYRNESIPGDIRFIPVARPMGIDKAGSWMGFAVGDYDSDADLDIFITNAGFHPLLRLPPYPGGDCAYGHRFVWGTCSHFLLRNDWGNTGLIDLGSYVDVAPSTRVKPSRLMPPESLNPSNIMFTWQPLTGLAAYDFGFGTVFFDLENDGDQDLYWLGSIIARGEGPRGEFYQSAGRLLRGDGKGSFEDVTVEAGVLDIQNVDYTILDPKDPAFNAEKQRIGAQFHENGKGLAKCDINSDGYIDLVGTNSSGEMLDENRIIGFARGPLFIWMNTNQDNHWIAFRLKGRMAIDGTGTNADGIGARVYVTTTGPDGNPKTQVGELTASGTFLSSNCLDMHFGLGNSDTIKQVEIRWPSGIIQTLSDVKADQILSITEPPAK